MKFNSPIWIIYFLIIITILFLLRLSGLLIEKYILIFTAIWLLIPILITILIFSKAYKIFNSHSLKYFKATTLIFVIVISFFSFAKFSDYSNEFEDFCIEQYGEYSNFSKNTETMIKKLAKEYPEFNKVKASDYKDKYGNDIYFKIHTNLSKIIFKSIEILFAALIFLIPISTWKLNKYIENYYEL